MNQFRFEDPWFLLVFLAALPGLWVLGKRYWGKSKVEPRLHFSSTKSLQKAAPAGKIWMRGSLVFLRALGVGLFVLALMRPQIGTELTEVNQEVVDINLVLDTSGSMRALDFYVDKKRATRLEAVKQVVNEFIQNRPEDRIGMVVFGEDAFTQCPQTLDHQVLVSFLDEIEIGMAGDATALGSAVAVATKRLKDLKGKSKVIVLVTDGRSNAGVLSPVQAAEIAKSFGIKMYTIGVGSKGKAPFLVEGFFGKQLIYQEVDLDEDTLKKMASITGGKYFSAKDMASLAEVYAEIDDLEKTEIKTKKYLNYKEHFAKFVGLGLFLILGEIALAHTRFQKIP